MEEITNALAVLFVGAIVLAPVLALSLRFALRPFWESYLRMREAQTPELLERRVALLEAELQHLEQTLSRMADSEEFRRQLGNSRKSTALVEGSAAAQGVRVQRQVRETSVGGEGNS